MHLETFLRTLLSPENISLVMAIQQSKEALGRGTLERLPPEVKRKAFITKLHDLFQVNSVEDLWNQH